MSATLEITFEHNTKPGNHERFMYRRDPGNGAGKSQRHYVPISGIVTLLANEHGDTIIIMSAEVWRELQAGDSARPKEVVAGSVMSLLSPHPNVGAGGLNY